MATEKKATKAPVKTEAPKEEKALAPKASAAVGAVMADEWDLGKVDSSDIIIPKLLIMQAPSKLVAQEKAQMGDIVNSVSGDVLGTCREKDNKPVQFIPFKEEKTWTIFELVGSKPEFRQSIARTPNNDNLEREYQEGGKNFRRYRTLSYWVLLNNELENSDMPLPYVLSFRSTGFKAGKVLSTHFVLCKAALQKGKMVPPPATVFELSGDKVSNDKGTFFVPNLKNVGATKEEFVVVAAQWLRTLKTKSYQIDESDVSDAEVNEEAAVIRDVKQGEVQDGAQF